MADDNRNRDRMKASPAAPARERTEAEGGATEAWRRQGEETAEEYREIQRRAEARREARGEEEKGGAVQPGDGRREPTNPLPKQHQEKPGIEAELEPRPRYEAPTYKGSDKLKGMVALITGADSGIGRAVAVLYAREGADVAAVYLSEHQDAAETKRAVEAEGRRCILIPGDVTEPRFCRDAVDRTVGEFGQLDVLVNNAAFQEHQGSVEDISEEQWDRTFKTNIYGYFHMVKAALPHLRAGSVILNTSSITAFEGSAGLIDYASTKGAINSFTRALAHNLVEKGIRVNGVAPGPVWTPLNPADAPAEEVQQFGADSPMKRPAQPEEVAPAYVFLAAPSCSSYITGEVLLVTGGEGQG